MSTKTEILSILRKKSDSYISGELISSELKLSRVSVWKHISKLNTLGYKIESGPTGYKLSEETDLLYPWEFGRRESLVHFFKETGSTMTEAHKLIEKNCPDRTIVIAEKQKNGRGRMSRLWISDAGGLYFSYVLKPGIPYSEGWYFNFTASLSLVKVLDELYEIKALIKWPNDIVVPGNITKKRGWENYFGSRKIAGILSDMQTEAEMIKYLNIGIGINVNNRLSETLPDSCSVKQLTGDSVSRRELLLKYLDVFEKYLRNADKEKLINEWKNYSIVKDADVKIVTPKETVYGRAIDIDNQGALILKLKNGTLKKIIFGDCFPAEKKD